MPRGQRVILGGVVRTKCSPEEIKEGKVTKKPKKGSRLCPGRRNRGTHTHKTTV